jgi:hypothetical protein
VTINVKPVRTVDAEEVRRSWPDTLSAVSRKGARLVVEENGIAIAAIVSLQDLERLARLDAEREAGFAALERIAASFPEETEEESERISDLAIAEVREEMRRERAARGEV